MLLKRIFDVAVSAGMLILLSPLLVLVALAVALDSGFPIFYSQIRIGRFLKPFRIWKFRSMRTATTGPSITSGGDLRITRVGKFLRATKIDELPQLWNVLIGEMSLVGPRPEVPEYVELFRARYERILRLRPGITDLASLKFRNEEAILAASLDPAATYREQILPAKLDLAEHYAATRTFWMDVWILSADCRPNTPQFRATRRRSKTQGAVAKTLSLLLRALERTGQHQRPIIVLVQIAIFFFAGVAAFLLRFDFTIPASERDHLTLVLVVWIAAKTVVFRISHLERGWWKFISIADVQNILRANLAASVFSTVAIRLLAGPSFPRSLFPLDFLLCFLASAGVCVAVRVNAESADQELAPAGRRVLIYGAGVAGSTLLREIRSDPFLRYDVCGFVDDNPGMEGVYISGAPVLGTGAALTALVRENNIREVLIAVPSADGAQLGRILHLCQSANVPRRTIPGMSEVIQGNGLAPQIREIEVEDLLARRPVHLNDVNIASKLGDQVVMVTGAGGSTGAELCRQIARSGARSLVAFDVSEGALITLGADLERRFPGFTTHQEIGSTQNERRVREVIARHRPSIVFHAAAYGHVPTLEQSPFESVENNVFGSVTIARCAVEFGLTDFVMLSTDKAVNPTSIMGASRRIAELAVASLGNRNTRCVSVRLGNLLGSGGSVVSLFRGQIAQGGPLKITHPEMERYFMTIPEAVQLVLQASALGEGGEVFVLDMGEPVKIVDLARNLIVLSGFQPEDIRIEFTGIRPGEKLSEEIQQMAELVLPSRHEKIRILKGVPVPAAEMDEHLRILRKICESRNLAWLLQRFQEIVPEFTPGPHLLEAELLTLAGHSVVPPVMVPPVSRTCEQKGLQ